MIYEYSFVAGSARASCAGARCHGTRTSGCLYCAFVHPHLSEYSPARLPSRAVFSGFTGSAGTLIVTNDFAGVWVDSRYWTQAETQLAGSGAARMKITAQSAVPYLDWLLAHIPAGGTIGVDGGVLSLACAHTLLDACNARDIA